MDKAESEEQGMKLIIDIPEELKQKIDEGFTNQVITNKLWDATKNGTPIPENATNGEVVMAMFPNEHDFETDFDTEWWNAKYKAEGEVIALPSVSPQPKTGHWIENLCDTCDNKACIFQSGIKRSKCDFYTSHLESDNCGNYIVQIPNEVKVDDCISRNSVLKIMDDIETAIHDGEGFDYSGWSAEVYMLPSVYPKNEALEQEPCDDAISRQAVLDIWHTSYSDNREENDEIQYKKIAFELPPVNPQESKTDYKAFAEWVAEEIFDENWEYNKDAFAELACRKLAKLGFVRAKGDEWELVEPQESEVRK